MPRREHLMGWLFVGPFGVVFLAFLIAPLGYALYLSLFQKKLIGGTSFVLFDNYVKAFTDPSFLSGAWFVLRFAGVDPAADPHRARAGADPGRGDHSVRPLLPPHDLSSVRDPHRHRGGDVGFLYSKGFGPLTDIFGFSAPPHPTSSAAT
ncbi:hypothetical protein NKG94_04740 [Micromonospora sp. M12]